MNGDQIRTIRHSQGLTQEAFAAKWGLNVKTYRDWEADVREPKDAAALWLWTIALHPVAATKVIKRWQRS